MADYIQFLRGDGSEEIMGVPPVIISETDSPIKVLNVKAADGREFTVPYRFWVNATNQTAIIFLHGGFTEYPEPKLEVLLRDNPVYTRLLQKGFGIVAGTFRTYDDNPQSEGPVLDAQAIYNTVKSIPSVKNIVIFGGSGGGSLALRIGALEKPAGIIIGEPASIIFLGILKSTAEIGDVMRNALQLFGPELQGPAREKIAKITAPILFFQGTIHPLKHANKDILLPELKAAGKAVTFSEFPGRDHGFYFGQGTTADESTVTQVVDETSAFINSVTKPRLSLPIPTDMSMLTPKVKLGLAIGGGLVGLYLLRKIF